MSFETMPPELPTVEQQRDLLAVVQARHLDAIIESGLADKIKIRLGAQDNEPAGQLMISTGRVRSGDKVCRVTASCLRIEEKGIEFKEYRHIDVAQEIQGMIAPCGSFSWEEAEQVAGLVNELSDLKHENILPNLSGYLIDIIDPSTAITRHLPGDL